MSPEKFKESSSGISSAMEPDILRATQGIEQVSTEDVKKYRTYMDVEFLIANLANANLSHNMSHNSYDIILRLRDLIYRLLAVLGASVLLVSVAASTALEDVSDVFNASIAITLVCWTLWLLCGLGREMKRVVAFEKQVRLLKIAQKDGPSATVNE